MDNYSNVPRNPQYSSGKMNPQKEEKVKKTRKEKKRDKKRRKRWMIVIIIIVLAVLLALLLNKFGFGNGFGLGKGKGEGEGNGKGTEQSTVDNNNQETSSSTQENKLVIKIDADKVTYKSVEYTSATISDLKTAISKDFSSGTKVVLEMTATARDEIISQVKTTLSSLGITAEEKDV